MARFVIVAAKNGREIAADEISRVCPTDYTCTVSQPRPDLAIVLAFDPSWEAVPEIRNEARSGSSREELGSAALMPQRDDSFLPTPRELLGNALGSLKIPRPFVAIAWDHEQVRVIADELAGRTVWFYESSRSVVIGSSPALILNHPHVRVEPNLAAIVERLSYRMSSHTQSVYDGFRQLGAGQALHVEHRGVRISQWHTFGFSPHKVSIKEAAEQAYALTSRSLSDELNHRQPSQVALHLSGGLDSASLAGLTTELGLDHNVTALMRRYPNLPNDESIYQEAVLQGSAFKTKVHTPREFDLERDLTSRVDRVKVPILPADPTAAQSSAWAADAGIKTEITGVGGDEIFAEADGSLLSYFQARQWRRCFAVARGSSPRSIAATHLEFAPAVIRRWRTRYRPWLTDNFANEVYLPLEVRSDQSPEGRAQLRFDWLLGQGWFSVSGEVREELYAHRRTEGLAPFLHPELVQWALNVPDWQRSSNDDSRNLQRQAFWAILPREIQERRGKVHFDYQMALNLQTPEVSELLKNLELAGAGFVNQESINMHLDQLLRAASTNIRTIPPLAGPLWSIVGIELWWRQTFGSSS